MIVLDSSFVVGYFNRRDAHHARAAAVMDGLIAKDWGDCLLPEYVFLEVTTVLAARVDLLTAARVGRALLEARELELVPCSEHFLDAFETFRDQPDGLGLSFADSAILAIARRRGAEHVATFDRAFRRIDGIAVVPG